MTAASEVTLRAADQDDCARALAWANDPAARAASFSVAPIGEDEHVRWFESSLRGARTLYVIEALAQPAGLVRLDPIDRETAEVGIVIGAEFRGQGLAASALRALLPRAAAAGFRLLLARIREENVVSQRVFAAVGFESAGHTSVLGVRALQFTRRLDGQL
jgi:RimJ/RimL family protein N-acetyltransferase